MIHIAICDDEEVFVEKIRSEARTVLETQDEDFEIFCYTDGNKLLADYEAKKFDLVLLDIDMPDVDGFEVAEKLSDYSDEIKLVFTSSYENLVFESIKYSPFRFIRKKHLKSDMEETIDAFLKVHCFSGKTIELSTDCGNIAFKITKICYIESDKHDIYVYSNNDTFKLKRDRKNSYSLKNLEPLFVSYGFIRTHKSFLVNFRFIKSIEKDFIKLKDMKILPIGVNRYMDIKKEYLNWIVRENL